MLRLLFLIPLLIVVQSSNVMYSVTKHFHYDDGISEECVCVGFNPDSQNDEAEEGRSKRSTKDVEDMNLPSVKTRNEIDRSKYSVNKRIDFSGDGYEDCACTPKTRRVSRRIRNLSSLPHRVLMRRHRREKPRVDSWLATSYEEDDDTKRHYKFKNPSKPENNKEKEDKTLDELLNDVVTTKKPLKTSKGKPKGKAGGKSSGKSRRSLDEDTIFDEIATGSVLGELTHPGVRIPEPEGIERERLVRVFTKQLLTALGHMHAQGLAHLDLRPESILLQDDKLILADFGSSRKLDRTGTIRESIKGSPEFVSPEIVNGQPITLASDLWSVGTLTYILLTGVSPFHGDNDAETLKNVSKGSFRTDTEEWNVFSLSAKAFIQKLLTFDPNSRPSVKDALCSEWLAETSLVNSSLSADSLREFRYKHKWLERRVFVQQTPSNQRYEQIEPPSIDLNSSHPYISYPNPTRRANGGQSRQQNQFDDRPLVDEKGEPIPFDSRQKQQETRFDSQGRALDPFHSSDQWRSREPPAPSPDQSPIPVDQFGRFVHPEELARLQQRQLQQNRGQEVQLDPYGRPLFPPADRRQFVDQFGRPIPPEILRRLQQRQEEAFREPPPAYFCPPHSGNPMGERRRLEPQQQGEAPATQRFHQQPLTLAPFNPEENPLAQVPIRMIRGEHRPIEEEIANRILSDISEEGSLAGSLASLEELEPYFAIRDYRYQPRNFRDRSGSSTPRLEENLSEEEDLSSSPSLSPKTVKESENFTPAGPLSPPAALSPGVSEKEETKVEKEGKEEEKKEGKEEGKKEEEEEAKEEKKEQDKQQEFDRASKSSTPSTLKEALPELKSSSPLKDELYISIESKKEEKKGKESIQIQPIIEEIFLKTVKREENNNMETSIAHVHVPDKVPVEELRKMEKEILKEIDADPKLAIGCPIFVEPLERHHPFLISPSLQVEIPLVKDGTLSPASPAITPKRGRTKQKGAGGTGMKSLVVSPGREHSMEVLIATKRGKPEFIAPGEEVPELDDDERKNREKEAQLKPKMHSKDEDFEDKQPELERIKKNAEMQRKMLDDLDKYRVGNYYKEDDGWRMNEEDIDASPWDSHYQIGPDTYLMASRGAAFNSRVRDYRRELWGDGASLVRQGYLGVRNRDITVRERRRYTDILRETQHNVAPKSAEHATMNSKDLKANAVARIRSDIEKVAPAATKKNQDGTFAAIFVKRLRDTYLVADAPSVVFECQVLSSPTAELTWTKHGRVVSDDGKHKLHTENGVHFLTILQPSLYDLGEYACHAKNEFGSDQSHARLISGEAPSRPGRPSLELSSDTEIFMTFDPPEGPTYLEGIMYRVECRLAGENDYDAPWITVCEKVEDEAVCVKNLEPLGIYQFRIVAKNGFGWGDASLHSRIVRTHPRGSPKLQLDELSRTVRFEIINFPGKRVTKKKTMHHPYDGLYSNLPASIQPKSLAGISEESEETEEDSSSLQSTATQSKEIELQGDLGGRFELGSLIFSTKYSIIRNANDTQKDHNSRCVAKLRHCGGESEGKNEFEMLRLGQHENVQRLLAASLSGDFLSLFVERLYEDVFARFSYADHYTEEQIAIVARQVAAALHWLHFKGIAHLDVNPHNVMFESKRSWIVKLVDFSSAQLIGNDAKYPEEKDVQWCAPEFHVGDTPVTVQSDIWGLGIITFCLLGGFHPFTSEFDTFDEVKENVINVKCDPNLIPVQASQDALSFVTWSLKKNPLRRMRTDEALSHRFVSSDPASVRRREAIRYSSNRLRKTAHLTKQTFLTPRSQELQKKFGNN
ncbi:unnamed protein product, partial [Mesorhabditis belari]|uniref:Uncharacterized protein n=1 Tax=Mesorhabditis belari TaxID=2138241 RepID=A0AAF3FE40_9BILA